MKRICIILAVVFLGLNLRAQEAFDLLKYSMTEPYGTARAMSMANAFGALGGDMSSLAINPAGLGIYRSGELTYTHALSSVGVSADFRETGVGISDRKTRTLPANFGFVSAYRTDNEEGFANYNFAVSYNRLKNFSRHTAVRGVNRPVSLLDNLVVNSGLEDFMYKAYMLDDAYNPILAANETVDNEQYMMESGRSDVWDFGFGFNYGYFVYFGMAIGVQSINYRLDTYYQEVFELGGDFRLSNDLRTSGNAINAKFGLILRPTAALRLGLAVHTPTYYDLVDVTSTTMTASGIVYDNVTHNTVQKTNNGQFSSYAYHLKTPTRMVYSAAFQLGRRGFLSADLEQTFYSAMQEKDAYGYVYNDVSADVHTYFRDALNLRLGLEWRFSDVFSGRCGYAHYMSPVRTEVITNNIAIHTPTYTPQYSIDRGGDLLAGGCGLHFDGWYLDLAATYSMRGEHFHPFYNARTDAYGDVFTNYAKLDVRSLNIAATLGFRF